MISLIITGDKHSGKSTFSKILYSRIMEQGLASAGGIIQVPHHQKEEQTEWYLSNLRSGEERLLLTTKEREGWPHWKRFWINQGTFKWANEYFINPNYKHDFLIIDEIGPLELEGLGYHEALVELVRRDELECDVPIIIAVVRRELVDTVIERYSLETTLNFDTKEPWEEQFKELVRDE